MRFLLDENVHHGLISFLSGQGHDVMLSPKGLSNGAVLDKAISDHRTLITHDKDFAEKIITFSHPGIILVRIPSKNFEELKSAMRNFVSEKATPDAMVNRLFTLFSDRFDESKSAWIKFD